MATTDRVEPGNVMPVALRKGISSGVGELSNEDDDRPGDGDRGSGREIRWG